jgi:hypothetical protein
MFGDAVAMQSLVRDSRTDDFCFEIFLTLASQHDATRQSGNKKTSLRPLTLTSRHLARTFGAIMTSISATSGSNYLSPLQLLQNELQTEVSSGAISSTDQSALSSALNDINSSLQNDGPSSSTGGANASPGDLKSKIDTLIAGEVSSGKLTSDQATELQSVFAAAFANGPGGAGDSTSATSASAAGGGLAPAGPGGPGGPGGAGGAHGGHHGGHGGPPPTGSSSSSSSSGGSTSSSSGTTANDILQQFLQSLQNSLSSSSSSSYSASGSSTAGSGSSSFSALLINYQT